MNGRLTPIFYGRVAEGKFELDDREGFKKHVSTLSGEVQLTLEPRRKDRSIEQNRYYWGVVVALIADHTGMLKEDIHHWLKSAFLAKVELIATKTGAQFEMKTARSTTSLSTVEAEEYFANIRQWAWETLAVSIPLPNEPALLSLNP